MSGTLSNTHPEDTITDVLYLGTIDNTSSLGNGVHFKHWITTESTNMQPKKKVTLKRLQKWHISRKPHFFLPHRDICLLSLLWACVWMTTKLCDLWVTNKFLWVGELTKAECENKETQLYMQTNHTKLIFILRPLTFLCTLRNQ